MFLLTRLNVHDERGFFDQPIEYFVCAFEPAFQLYKSDAFFACFAKFYLPAPFGF